MTTMAESEQKNRAMLQGKKPRVYEKIITHGDKIVSGESVAMAQIQWRHDCNFKCKHCGIENLKDPSRPLITLADVKNIADQLDEMGIASICISGGEPITFPELPDVIKAIGPDRFNIAMDTNGSLLTDEKIKWIMSLGIDRIQLSIDGQENSHNAFRKADGSFVKCIKTLQDCKKNGLRVIINVVATKKLVESGELVRHLDFLSQFDEHISVIFAKSVGAFEGHEDDMLGQAECDYVQTLTSKYNMSTHQTPNCGHNFGCFCMKRWFSITPYGDLMPCPWIPIKIGNVLEEPIKDIVNRGLGIKWFGYDYKAECLCGNKDDVFFQTIMPQLKGKRQPVSWEEIDWEK